jgi:hypothetical protein
MKPMYNFVGVDAALHLLRPNGKWSLVNGDIHWEDERPAPTKDEINDAIQRIIEFEESFDYILTEEDKQRERPDWSSYKVI